METQADLRVWKIKGGGGGGGELQGFHCTVNQNFKYNNLFFHDPLQPISAEHKYTEE